MSDLPSAGNAQRVDETCDRCEAAWKAAGTSGSPPQIEDFLKDVAPTDSALLLHELIHLDVHYRRQRGETPKPEDYLGRFPALDAGWLTAQLVATPGMQQGSADPGELPTCAEVGTSSASPPAATPLSEGRYLILGEIARGGMGAILRGKDPDFDRELAIKVILPENVQHQDKAVRREMLDRFLAEARIAGQLQHPGIVPVYELGEFPGDRRYFTMKLVKGRTLAALLEERPGPGHELPRFLKIFEQVCQTVAYAHSRRVIHRDLKPLNIMVGAFGEVQVMDWGLAKVMGESAEPAGPAREAAPGATNIRTDPRAGPGLASQHGWGTLEYMPPEQARGEVDRLDAPCDVFALGAILCKILTGQPPYVGRGAEALRLQAMMADLGDAFARLDACGAEPELIRLARHCLAARPEDRPADAGAVATAVSAYLAGVQERLKEAEMARAAALVRAAEERKRRRLAVALAAAVLVMVVAGGAGWWWVKTIQDAHAAEEARRAADAERNVLIALQEAAALRAQSHKLLDHPSQWQATLNEARSAAKRAEDLLSGVADDALREHVRQRKRELDQEEEDRKMAKKLEHIRLHIGGVFSADFSGFVGADADFEKAFTQYGLDFAQLETAEAIQRINRSLIKVELAEALGAWSLGRGFIGKGNDDLTRRLGAVHVGVSPVYVAFFIVLKEATDKKNPAAIRSAVDVIVADKHFPTLSAQRINAFAFLCLNAGAGGQAEFLYRKCQQARPDDFWANWNLASYHLSFAAVPNPGEAARFLQVAQALRPDIEEVRQSVGNALLAGGEYERALVVLETASQASPNSADIQVSLGAAWQGVWELERAAEHFRKALGLKADYPEAHLGLGQVRSAQGRDDEAQDHYRAAIKLGDSFVATLTMRQMEEAFKKFAGANKEVEQLIQRFSQQLLLPLLEKAPGAGDCYLALGTSLRDQGKLDEAVAALRQAAALKPRSGLVAHTLSHTFLMKGQLAEGEKEAQRWLELGTTYANVPVTPAQYYEGIKPYLELDKKLPALLNGKENPGDDPQRLIDLANVCVYRNYPVAAVQYYRQFMAKRPDLAYMVRYEACRAALRAAAGRGKDAQNLVAVQYRLQARLWLLEERSQCLELLRAGTKQDQASAAQEAGRWPSRSYYSPACAQLKVSLEQKLRRWKQNPDLAIIRDKEALAKLPAEEQKELREFWANVDSDLAFVTTGAIPPKAPPVEVQPVPGPAQARTEWFGTILDDSLAKLKPENGAIVDQKELAKLWKAWRKDEVVPVVDFTKHFVAVLTTKERNFLVPQVPIRAGTDFIIAPRPGTEKLAKGFDYEIHLIERAGIKTFNGKPLPTSETPVAMAWVGIQLDDSLEKLKPKSGVIVDQKKFAKLWKAWRKGEVVPVVDFTKQFVAVISTRVKRPANFPPNLQVRNGTDLSLHPYEGTEKLAKGFEYEIHLIERADIKTFNGKPLPTK